MSIGEWRNKSGAKCHDVILIIDIRISGEEKGIQKKSLNLWTPTDRKERLSIYILSFTERVKCLIPAFARVGYCLQSSVISVYIEAA